MGYELRRWLADRLPVELSSGERLVALEIADQANEKTRLAYGKHLLATVARRTGFADEKQVGNVLGKLAKRGLELRVQLLKDGKPHFDKKGRPVFAFDGKETTYRVPNEHDLLALAPSARDQGGPPDTGPVNDEWSRADGQVVPPARDQVVPPARTCGPVSAGPFSSCSPQEISSSLSHDQEVAGLGSDEREMKIDPLTQRLMNEHQATEDDVEDVLDSVRREGVIRSIPAWASSDTGRADFARRLADHRRYVARFRAWDDYEEVAPAPDGSLSPPGPPPWLPKASNGSGPDLPDRYSYSDNPEDYR